MHETIAYRIGFWNFEMALDWYHGEARKQAGIPKYGKMCHSDESPKCPGR